MATVVPDVLSSHEKMQRAREAAFRLAAFTTAEKNALLQAMADAIEANADAVAELISASWDGNDA